MSTGVDFKSKSLRCREVFKGTEHDVDYDCLVIATGAQNNTFGVPGVNEVSNWLFSRRKSSHERENARPRQAERKVRRIPPDVSSDNFQAGRKDTLWMM